MKRFVILLPDLLLSIYTYLYMHIYIYCDVSCFTKFSITFSDTNERYTHMYTHSHIYIYMHVWRHRFKFIMCACMSLYFAGDVHILRSRRSLCTTSLSTGIYRCIYIHIYASTNKLPLNMIIANSLEQVLCFFSVWWCVHHEHCHPHDGTRSQTEAGRWSKRVFVDFSSYST